ncbi:iron-only hydrogenase maturation protein HydE [Coriobacterium glomerans PW2]|uniref:Iron-only hydrogenase maturation protein HydE n=1 Tax=Coriobacterium glomerans (strain ATCC 49209 / DSM 20642 / JCM 10262 / PW2) TaxID=700015 RepID=F2N7U2_CORGP|nr:[FeFe] hydrogenase H-cluster radical SAM maturase HydE [Coriobacterium glomerans]AEB07051.1 iron-only hydrogenase maturation protein HydE [Coriobacterium glomerans PW2]
MLEVIDKLYETRHLTRDEWVALIEAQRSEERHHLTQKGAAPSTDAADGPLTAYLFERARAVRRQRYGDKVFIRGLIEISNRCRNDCLYCGIRRSNECAERYRLQPADIIACTDKGYELGFRTFVMQGGEDPFFTDEVLCPLIERIKANHPDCAITLSLGERTRESYQRLFDAGADRYLLRHETATDAHYRRLHPSELSLATRKACLSNLKEIGYQTGAGFMVGSPYQTVENLADDMLYLDELQPQMVGIGPFIPHRDTPFRDHAAGSVAQTLFFLGCLRLMLPASLLPATTAIGTLDPQGREKGMLAGANVVMPNLSPPENRGKYLLYNDKLATGCEAAEHLRELDRRFAAVGMRIAVDRGDFAG